MALPKREYSMAISEATRSRYIQNLQAQVQMLRNAMEKSDFEEVRAICHRVQGSAGLFGMKDLGEACRAMEEAAIANLPTQVVEAFQVIEVILARKVEGPIDAQV